MTVTKILHICTLNWQLRSSMFWLTDHLQLCSRCVAVVVTLTTYILARRKEVKEQMLGRSYTEEKSSKSIDFRSVCEIYLSRIY